MSKSLGTDQAPPRESGTTVVVVLVAGHGADGLAVCALFDGAACGNVLGVAIVGAAAQIVPDQEGIIGVLVHVHLVLNVGVEALHTGSGVQTGPPAL